MTHHHTVRHTSRCQTVASVAITRAALVILGAVSCVAYASETPPPCSTDDHIRCAIYNPSISYRIPFRIGQATVIQFEAGETIDSPSAGLGTGDAKGWAISGRGNWFMFKPASLKPETNVVIVTNRRRYVFQFDAAARNESAIWALSFDYPDTRAKQAVAAKAKAEKAQALNTDTLSEHRSDDYDMKGDVALAPTALWDDGRFTYFQYDTTRQTPDIYQISPDGHEALAAIHVEGDTTVIQSTAPGFVLRLGKAVLAIRNNAYNPDGTFNRSGTTMPGWVRMLKEANHDQS